MKEVSNFSEKATKDVQSKGKSINKVSLFKSPLIKLQIEHANSVKELKKLEKNSSLKKSKINFIERNKSISRFKKNVGDQTRKKASKLLIQVNNKLSSKSTGKKSPNEKKKFRQRFRISLKFRKNLAKFFSSIFARIFRKTKFKQVKSESKSLKVISPTKDLISEIEANSQSSTSNSEIHSPDNSKVEINYSNDCEVASTDFYQVDDLECEKFEIKILKISINESFNFNQVSITENTIFEHIVEKKSSFEDISIEDSLSSQSENQIVECRKSPSNEIRNESLSSNSQTELRPSIDESKNEDNLGSTSKFENNLMNLYETHQKIVDKYLKSNLDEECGEKCSKTFLIVPSLYEKYGFHLVNLFKSQVDEPFLPYYVDPRLVGECLYQLDQRVFSYVFRLTPFNRRNISEGYQPFDIIATAEHFSNESGLSNEKKFSVFMNRYNYLMKSFHEIGFKEEVHPNMAAYLIMKYGLYPCLPIDFQINCKDFSQFEILFRILIKNLNNAEKEYMTVLYLCLLLLAFDDQKPIFLHD